MERSGAHHRSRVDIAKCQHVVEAILPPSLVTALTSKFCRVLERAEENVPNGQVAEVIGVMAELMVHSVRFRSLEKVTEPSGCFNVPMVEEFSNRDQQSVIPRGLEVAPEERVND
jgi:hypothetical protein